MFAICSLVCLYLLLHSSAVMDLANARRTFNACLWLVGFTTTQPAYH